MAIERLGPYRLDKMLGRGGMGTVYAAHNVKTGERAAVKILATSIAQEEHFRQRFEAEIKSLIKLDHPNIVRILAYDIDGEHMYYAMELVEGRSLFDEQKSGRRFNWREVAQIGIETCAALRHAHDRGILHRDLKPGNLLLDHDGRIKLTDFGIAKLFGGRQMTADGGIIGTVDFMSPEQAKGEPTSPRSDLYSLGSVMFALLARRPPFAAKTITAALHSLSVDAAPSVRDFAPETPAEMEKIIDKLLAKDPSNRIGSAQAVAKRLQEVLDEVEDSEASTHDHEFDIDDGHDPNLTKDNALSRAEQPTVEPPSIGALALTSEARPTRRSPTLVDQPGATTNPQQTSDKRKIGFTEVDDEIREREDDLGRHTAERQTVWPLALALVVVVALVGLGIYFASRPPSADDLYQTIQAAAEDEDAGAVVAVEDECRDFLARFPEDSRADSVRETLDRIESIRFPRNLLRKRQAQGLESLSPAEQIFVQAMEVSENNPEQAITELNALIGLFKEDPDEDDCVDASRIQVRRLQKIANQIRKQHIEVLNQRLELAKRLRDSNSSSADSLLSGIIQLYADKPWAADQVERAKELRDGVQP